MHTTQAPPVLTVPEFAAALRVHPASIYRRIQSGEIKCIRLGSAPGGRLRIRESELVRLLEPAERRGPDDLRPAVEPRAHGGQAA